MLSLVSSTLFSGFQLRLKSKPETITSTFLLFWTLLFVFAVSGAADYQAAPSDVAPTSPESDGGDRLAATLRSNPALVDLLTKQLLNKMGLEARPAKKRSGRRSITVPEPLMDLYKEMTEGNDVQTFDDETMISHDLDKDGPSSSHFHADLARDWTSARSFYPKGKGFFLSVSIVTSQGSVLLQTPPPTIDRCGLIFNQFLSSASASSTRFWRFE